MSPDQSRRRLKWLKWLNAERGSLDSGMGAKTDAWELVKPVHIWVAYIIQFIVYLEAMFLFTYIVSKSPISEFELFLGCLTPPTIRASQLLACSFTCKVSLLCIQTFVVANKTEENPIAVRILRYQTESLKPLYYLRTQKPTGSSRGRLSHCLNLQLADG